MTTKRSPEKRITSLALELARIVKEGNEKYTKINQIQRNVTSLIEQFEKRLGSIHKPGYDTSLGIQIQDLDMGRNNIINLPDGTEAISRKYFEDNVGKFVQTGVGGGRGGVKYTFPLGAMYWIVSNDAPTNIKSAAQILRGLGYNVYLCTGTEATDAATYASVISDASAYDQINFIGTTFYGYLEFPVSKPLTIMGIGQPELINTTAGKSPINLTGTSISVRCYSIRVENFRIDNQVATAAIVLNNATNNTFKNLRITSTGRVSLGCVMSNDAYFNVFEQVNITSISATANAWDMQHPTNASACSWRDALASYCQYGIYCNSGNTYQLYIHIKEFGAMDIGVYIDGQEHGNSGTPFYIFGGFFEDLNTDYCIKASGSSVYGIIHSVYGVGYDILAYHYASLECHACKIRNLESNGAGITYGGLIIDSFCRLTGTYVGATQNIKDTYDSEPIKITETIAHSDFTDSGGASGYYNFTEVVPGYYEYISHRITFSEAFKDTVGNNTAVTIMLGTAADDDRFNPSATPGTDDIWNSTTTLYGTALEAQGTIKISASTQPRVTLTTDSDFTNLKSGAGSQGIMTITMIFRRLY